MNFTPSFKFWNSVLVQDQKNINIKKQNTKENFWVVYLINMKILEYIKKKIEIKIATYIVLNILILSIISIEFSNVYANELKGLNSLFQIFNNKNTDQESLNQKDEIELIGISRGSIPLILLKINGSIFEIHKDQDKFDYKVLEIKNSSAIISKNNKEFEIEIGEKPILINVKSAVFTSNLKSTQISKNMISNNEMINLELQNFKKNVENKLTKLKLNNFEKEIIDEFINLPGRSDAGRLGFVVPEYIMQQSVKNYGLNKGDIILAINNIPIEKINDIYELYTDNNIKTYYIEIKRSNSLIMVEWYK